MRLPIPWKWSRLPSCPQSPVPALPGGRHSVLPYASASLSHRPCQSRLFRTAPSQGASKSPPSPVQGRHGTLSRPQAACPQAPPSARPPESPPAAVTASMYCNISMSAGNVSSLPLPLPSAQPCQSPQPERKHSPRPVPPSKPPTPAAPSR